MREITYTKAINEALRECMQADPSVVLLGEDIGKYGGVFQVTAGLLDEFGAERVVDTPISESGFVGMCVGAAMTGLRPVVEIMFIDFTLVAMDMIVNQMAKMRYMFGGRAKVPMVIRTNIGAGRGAAAQHSQSFHSIFMHIPGIRVVLPSTPYDAKGMMIEAVRDENPVLFIEHKKLYNVKEDVPEGSYTVPLGKAKVVREGKEVTIVALSGMVPKALAVAEEFSRQGVELEIVDLRSLAPLDRETVLASVAKTHRLITADEGVLTGGMGSEIAAIVAEEAFGELKGPILRVASPDTPVPFSPTLEKAFIPDEGKIKSAVHRMLSFDRVR